MRSENNNRDNRNDRSSNGNRAQSYAGRYRDQTDGNYRYNDYDREYNDDERDYNSYDRSDAGRYSTYESNYGRGSYNDYRDQKSGSRDYNSGGRYTTGLGSNSRSWDSQEPGYRYRDNDRSYSDYDGTRRRDEKDWGDGRNYASDYNNDGSYRNQENRGFFGRVGDRIRDTWHDITDRDDTSENMRRFKEQGNYGRRSSSNTSYDNRGNYRPYPEGSRDDAYGSSNRARNNNRGVYGDRRDEYGGYGLDRHDFNW